MRLLKVPSLEFVEYADELRAPRYGILSHRWDGEEVTYQDMLSGISMRDESFAKIRDFCRQCELDGLMLAWVDTCCIDKNSSAELSEAINSMYRWYQNAAKCYAYLSDADSSSGFADSRWFQRGWTLQELIAPNDVYFYDKDWHCWGSKVDLCDYLENITNVPQNVLLGESPSNYSIAQRMSWAAKRETTRVEDQAYSLMGLFNVNMPMLYGEGERAFIRLQEEIIKYSADHSIFAWPGIISEYDKFEMYDVTLSRLEGLLATSPAAFRLCGNIEVSKSAPQQQPFSVTNLGLSIDVLLRSVSVEVYEAQLNCRTNSGPVSIFVRQIDHDGQYVRHEFDGSLGRNWSFGEQGQRSRINVVQGYSDFSKVCEPTLILPPGPVSSTWFSKYPMTDKKLYQNAGYGSCISLPLGAHEATALLEMKGGPNRLCQAYFEFGFDFYFNPYLWVRISDLTMDRAHFTKDSELRKRADICRSSLWIDALERHILCQNARQSSIHGWTFEGHRSKGILIWLSGLNTVIDIQKKAFVGQKFWTIDVQKANPESVHFLSCELFPGAEEQSVNWFDKSREILTDKNRCPICLEFLGQPVTTTCQHRFCQSCFRWADISMAPPGLAIFEVLASTERQKLISCPLCGIMTEGHLDLQDQLQIRMNNPHNWRFTSWRSPNTQNFESYPALDILKLTVGNTHKMASTHSRITESDTRRRNNRHDWTFYVRPSHPGMIASIKIFLHETYHPCILAVSAPPFEIRRFGWLTFEIRVEVHLKTGYFFRCHTGLMDNDRQSKIEVRWTLNFTGDGDQGWVNLVVGRTKFRKSDQDQQLLAQYETLKTLRAATLDSMIISHKHIQRQTTPVESPPASR